MLSLPLNLVHRVLGGYQQSEITNYFNVFRNLLSLAAVLVVASLHGSLFVLMLIYSLSLMAGTVGLNLWMNLRNRRWMFPSPRHIDRATIGDLLVSGSGFFMLQIAGLIVFNSDNIVIAHYLGAAAVAPYSITWRVAACALVMQSSVSPSLWPAYSEAYARGDQGWLRKRLRRQIRLLELPASLAIFGPCSSVVCRNVWLRLALLGRSVGGDDRAGGLGACLWRRGALGAVFCRFARL